MAHLGFFCFCGTGHLNPALALGRSLSARGHTVTVFHYPLARAATRAAGLKFWPLGENTFPAHEGRRDRLQGRKWRITVEVLHSYAQMMLREAPNALKEIGLDALIVDQYNLAGGSIANRFGLPFVTISTAPPLYLDDSVPPTYFGSQHRTGPLARFRNRIANTIVATIVSPTIAVINKQRSIWKLPPLRGVNQTISTLAFMTPLT